MASEANAHKGLSEVVNDKSQKSKLNRACEACHALKIRCTIENASSSSKNCQRCTGLGQKCTFAAPRKRKPRLRPDIKIAELEKEVRAMRSFFNREKTNRNSSNVENKSPIDPSVRSQGSDGLLDYRSASNRFQLDGLSGPIYPSSIAQEPQYQVSATDPTLTSSESQSDLSQGLAVAINPTKPDVIDRGLLSMDTAEKYLQSYIVDMVPHYPALVFPEGYTAEELRNTRPVLFLAVMAAVAARSPDSAVASALSTELIREFAVEIFINSQKSLELVQALLITVLWYNPPRGQLKFYEYIHMAASMAVDLGIGVDISQSSISSGPDQGRDALRPSQARTSCYEPPSVYTKTNDNDVEGCRTLIACYLGCSG